MLIALTPTFNPLSTTFNIQGLQEVQNDDVKGDNDAKGVVLANPKEKENAIGNKLEKRNKLLDKYKDKKTEKRELLFDKVGLFD